MFLGDTHGDANWIKRALTKAGYEGCKYVVQCGDFGYWEHAVGGPEFLDEVSQACLDADTPLIWVDGNHENHSVLRANYGPEGDRHNPTAEGFWRIRPYVFHAPRGHLWVWDDVIFLALGGAYSIDREWRRPGTSFWWEETITDDEVEYAIRDGQRVDVMVTHDVPAGVKGAIPEDGTWDRQKDRWPESMKNRWQVRQVFDARQPKLLVHGHYHHRYTEQFNDCRIEGLGRDGDPGSMIVVDLGALK